jgi:hypothetical protein
VAGFGVDSDREMYVLADEAILRVVAERAE